MQNLARVRNLAKAAARLTGEEQVIYKAKECYEFTSVADAIKNSYNTIETII